MLARARVHSPDAATVNILRQALMADVPVLAADVVQLDAYDGPLLSEQVALHIGRLPMATTDKCPGPVECTIDVVNTTRSLVWVTSADVVCPPGVTIVHYRDDAEAAAAFADRGFRIAALHPGNRLQGKFKARVGTGREHVRWKCVHVIVRQHDDDRTAYTLELETTGAVTPRQAVAEAARAVCARLRTIANATPA